MHGHNISLPISWTLYPASSNDDNSTTANPALRNKHNSMSIATPVLRLALANHRAIEVIGAAPIWVRTTTITTTTSLPQLAAMSRIDWHMVQVILDDNSLAS